MQEVGDSWLGGVSRDTITTTSLLPLLYLAPNVALPPSLLMRRLGSQENDGWKLSILLTSQLGYTLPLDCSVARSAAAVLSLVVLWCPHGSPSPHPLASSLSPESCTSGTSGGPGPRQVTERGMRAGGSECRRGTACGGKKRRRREGPLRY